VHSDICTSAEKLINCVHEGRPLWDLCSKLYHNRDVSKKLWTEVGQDLKVTGIVHAATFKIAQRDSKHIEDGRGV